VFLKSAEFLPKDLTVEAAGKKGSRFTLHYGKGRGKALARADSIMLLHGIQAASVVAVFTT
jgi:hypothetical protein